MQQTEWWFNQAKKINYIEIEGTKNSEIRNFTVTCSMPLRTPMLRLDWELSFVNQTIPKMVSLGLSAWTFLHSHHVILTWLTYHQHLRQGVCVCIIYIKYIYRGKNITEKNASLTTGKKNNKFNMIGWHNDRYAPQSTRFLHTWFVDTQFIRSEVQNHRAKI